MCGQEQLPTPARDTADRQHIVLQTIELELDVFYFPMLFSKSTIIWDDRSFRAKHPVLNDYAVIVVGCGSCCQYFLDFSVGISAVSAISLSYSDRSVFY